MVANSAWQWTELVNATTQNEFNTDKGQAFVFGGIMCYISKERCKIVDGKFYAERWVARQSEGKWLGQFVGSRYTSMRPIDGSAIKLMSTITKMVKQGSELIAQGNAIIQQAMEMAKNIPDTELDEEAAKIIQMIRRGGDSANPH